MVGIVVCKIRSVGLMQNKLFLLLASVSGFLGVVLGAFGAHGLKTRVSEELLVVWHTGVSYQMYHSLALLVVGCMILQWPAIKLFRITGWLFIAGIVIFSGSLYLLTLSGVRMWGAVTPIGGLAFLAAWVTLFIGILQL